MKSFQKVIIILAAIIFIFSSVSLAKLNETTEIHFKWYSDLFKDFVSNTRSVDGDEWLLPENLKSFDVSISSSLAEYNLKINPEMKSRYSADKIDFNKYAVVQVGLSAPSKSGFRIKLFQIMRVANKIYFRVSVNSVSNQQVGTLKPTPNAKEKTSPNINQVFDTIIVSKSDLNSQDGIKYFFKDQYGNLLKSFS